MPASLQQGPETRSPKGWDWARQGPSLYEGSDSPGAVLWHAQAVNMKTKTAEAMQTKEEKRQTITEKTHVTQPQLTGNSTGWIDTDRTANARHDEGHTPETIRLAAQKPTDRCISPGK